MSKVSDKHLNDKKLTNLVNKKTDDIIDYFVGSLSESIVTEASDMNDPILVAIRAAKMRHKAIQDWDKANPKKRPLYGKARDKAQDTLWDISLELKDLYAERSSLYSDMDAEAGQKGSDWSDADANRYGGELNRVEDRIEVLIPKRKQLEIKLAQ